MTNKEIFLELFKVAAQSQDPEGVVATCLVKDGDILISSPSASDGIRHAEDLVIELAKRNNIQLDNKVIIYTTLEPCSYRSPKNNVKDCTSLILDAGIRNVVFAANDPEYSKEARIRCEKAGISYCQIEDKVIIRQATELFNSTITIPFTSMGLPRKKKLPED